MKTIGFVCVVIITIAVVAFGSAYKEREQEQNENVKEPMPLIPEDAENSVQESTNQPIGTGGFGIWSKVALWLIVIFLGLNVCQMFSMRNQTANLHKDIHKIMGLSAPNLTDCQDRINRERLY